MTLTLHIPTLTDLILTPNPTLKQLIWRLFDMSETSNLILTLTQIPGTTYTVKVAATLNGQAFEKTVSVTVQASSFQVRILEGESFAVQLGAVVNLNAKAIDPDEGTKTYKWGSSAPSSALIGSTTATRLSVNTSLLTPDSSYTFTVNATRQQGGTTTIATASVVVKVLSVPVPLVLINAHYKTAVFSSSGFLGLSATSTLSGKACATCNYAWSIQSGSLAGGKTLAASLQSGTVNHPSIVVKKNSLIPGLSVEFRCTVTQSTGSTPGYSGVVVKANGGPVNGTVVVGNGTANSGHLSGYPLGFGVPATRFTFTAQGFADADAPLSYKFGILRDGQTRPPSPNPHPNPIPKPNSNQAQFLLAVYLCQVLQYLQHPQGHLQGSCGGKGPIRCPIIRGQQHTTIFRLSATSSSRPDSKRNGGC